MELSLISKTNTMISIFKTMVFYDNLPAETEKQHLGTN